MATRVYWAIQALGINSDGGADSVGAADFVSGVQSVGITTTFNLEQVFQLGQLSLYQDVEEVPDVEVTVERVMDGQDLLYTSSFGEGTISANQNNRCGVYFNVYADTNDEVGDGNPDAGVYCSGMYVSSASFSFPNSSISLSLTTFPVILFISVR